MKHLQEYIVENVVNIFEGSGGFNKYFNSFEEAIEYYDNNSFIKNKYALTHDIIKQLYELSEGDVPFTIDESNKELKLRRFFQDKQEELKKFGNFNKTKSHFKFNNAKSLMKVGDGCFSVRAKSGRNTEPQELLFCDIVNNNGNINIDELLNKYKLDKSFKHSVEKQYKRIKEYLDNNDHYIAFRPKNDKSNLNKKLNKIYSNKKVFHGAQISYITPADVYMIKENKKNDVEKIFDDILDAFDKADSNTDYDVMFNDCKNKFITLINDKIFIPVSLKKIASGEGHSPELLNIKEYTVTINQDNYKLRLIDTGFVGDFFIENTNENIKFNFRSNQKTIYPLTFEFNKKGDGGAVGKFKNFVKSYIELNDNNCNLPTIDEFYTKYKENKNFDLIKFYNEKINIAKKLKNFEDPKYDNSKLLEIQKDDKLFYILVVCLLFIEFLYKLYNDNGPVNNFFIFIQDCYMASKKITKYSLPYLLIK